MVCPSLRASKKPFGGAGGCRATAGCSWKELVSFTSTELQNLFFYSENHQHKGTIKSFKGLPLAHLEGSSLWWSGKYLLLAGLLPGCSRSGEGFQASHLVWEVLQDGNLWSWLQEEQVHGDLVVIKIFSILNDSMAGFESNTDLQDTVQWGLFFLNGRLLPQRN